METRYHETVAVCSEEGPIERLNPAQPLDSDATDHAREENRVVSPGDGYNRTGRRTSHKRRSNIMAKTVVGLFETVGENAKVVQELLRSGFDRDEVINMRDPRDTVAMRAFMSADIPEHDARLYLDGVRRGDMLVLVRTSERKANQAANILRKYNLVDIQARSATYRQASSQDTRVRDLDTEGTVLHVVEEHLDVGTRQVQRGGIRIHTRVAETPVEEQVHLREERVNVERHLVDRPVSVVDANTFREQTVEVREMVEVPVVRKQARVVEEVIVRKEIQERTETVRDTVRRQDVQIEDQRRADAGATNGSTYDQNGPGYRYGASLASDPQYRDKEWRAIETDARQHWEERNLNTWEEFKDEIRSAWEKARGKS
jgi:stress response protein YsnF